MDSNNETGCVKTIAILAGIATIIGVFIAIFAWIMPFSPTGSSPLVSQSIEQSNTLMPIPTPISTKTIKPGNYQFNLPLEGSALYEWKIKLVELNISLNGDMKFTVSFYNNETETRELHCILDEYNTYLVLNDNTKIFPKDTMCNNNPGYRENISPGGVVYDWIIFPSLDNPTQKFTFYYEGLSTNEIILPTQ